MILYPAIDLKDGNCVRLLRGDMEAATVFGTDPAAQARAFQDAGAEWLHLVDLNGAFAGKPVNAAAVEAILAAITVPAQMGGGIRDMATIESWLMRGLSRVILGTVAVENPALVREAAMAFPGKIAVGIDARKGRVATRGWAEETDVMATDLAQQSGDALKEIVSKVEASADQVRAIATASEQQSATSEEINQSIVRVNEMSGQTAQAMGEASRAVSELARQAERMSELIADMKRG